MSGRTFADSLAADLDQTFLNVNEFAQEVVFARAADRATSKPVNAVLGEERAEMSIESPGVIVGYTRTITTQFGGDWEPQQTDQVTVGELAYSLKRLGKSDGNAWVGELHRKAATEVTRESYRRT